MKQQKSILRAVLGLAVTVAASSAWAGRPLTVDDANVNEKGAGHIEVWTERDSAKNNIVNLSPAYAPIEGLELAARVSRDRTNREDVTAVQAKWIITKSKEDGCNFGAALGSARTQDVGSERFVTGLFTCNGTPLGNVHVNLGSVKPDGAASNGTWGLALEKEMGRWTPHIEWFGQRHEKSTVQVGARTEWMKGVQVDGTVGRHDGETVYSLGFKIQF